MLGKQKFKISESVTAGHPDKIADQISDLILDWCLHRNSNAKVAIETMVTLNHIIISGEVSGVEINNDDIDIEIRKFLKLLGYDIEGFSYTTVKITFLIKMQSLEILNSVSKSEKNAAGDQGIVFGYAVNETKNYMPAPIYYSHILLSKIINDFPNDFGPDGKIQIVMKYGNNHVPTEIDQLLLSIQHHKDIKYIALKSKLFEYIKVNISIYNIEMCSYDNFLFNPSGSFVIGGPASDCGVTGRKIIVDSYGSGVPHGGGAFSGKDATKVDRSAAYMARYIAKNIVHKRLAGECLIKIAYAIGLYDPLLFHVYTVNDASSFVRDHDLENYFIKNFDLSPSGICKLLNLDLPIFFDTASYGHFGREYQKETKKFSWEKIDNSLFL